MAFFPKKSETYIVEIEVDEYIFDPNKLHTDLSGEKIAKVISRLHPLDSLGLEYANIYIPALPCLDIISSIIPRKNAGYIKASEGIQVIPSGKRSCIMIEDNIYIRLKGCGNLDKEFNIENMAYPPEGREIRGCCFENTVIREQYMTW